jgi:hypothetical protein
MASVEVVADMTVFRASFTLAPGKVHKKLGSNLLANKFMREV